MTSEPSISRPDPEPVFAGLKDFQRRTVEYAFERLYGAEEPTRRFLVADEVGLGKTLVARGVIAKVVDRLWEERGPGERIDIVYICSNREIAAQNVNRLRLESDAAFAEPTRMTLLPLTLGTLQSRRLNFISLTPGTSFDPQSSMGVIEERALLHLLLEGEWDLSGAPPRNLLAGSAYRDSLDEHLEGMRESGDIDEGLAERFRGALRTPRGGELRKRWEDLLPAFARAGSRTNRPEDVREAQKQLIADLRRLLAETCVEALEPDLIVLDEFQRFRALLQDDPETGHKSEAGELADVLFGYEDARVLLLSATPYKPYSRAGETEDDHYRDFIATARFLFDAEEPTSRLESLLREMRTELLNWREGTPDRLAQTKGGVEGLLRRVMCRTERLAAARQSDGMLVEMPARADDLRPRDLEAYLATAQIASIFDEPDQLDYWKSAPYLINLMDGYKLKRQVTRTLEDGADPVQRQELTRALNSHRRSLLPVDDFRRYRKLDPQNARIRALASDTIDREAWRLLWMPPSLPYYQPEGPYRRRELQGLTKRLVFSAWWVVPKAISTLLSYEAERQMMRLDDLNAENTPAYRENRGDLLGFDRKDGRPTGLPVMALVYPSFGLAEWVNVADISAGQSGSDTDRDEVLRDAMDLLRPEVERLTAGASREGRPDARWYWALPLLLDKDRNADIALEWLQDPELPARWPGVESKRMRSDAAWREHVDAAIAMTRDPSDLGRPPDDLLENLARIAIAGPGVASLRAIARATGAWGSLRDPEIRTAAGGIAWAFRSLFNSPEATALVRGMGEPGLTYWRQVLRYCVDGCLQAVLDEYAHILRESRGLVGDDPPQKVARDLAEVMGEAISLRTPNLSVDEVNLASGQPELKKARMRIRFAMPFGDHQSEEEKALHRAENVRQAFNSPFWPFVLASTSVGQEGLDFHHYCHAVVHWNLPSNPVDLEQREGRVHRYKGHAVRKNLSVRHGPEVLTAEPDDVWSALFQAGHAARPKGESDLHPFWITEGPTRIERHVLSPPLSRDEQRLQALKRSLTLYRMVFGQARQEDLVGYLAERVNDKRLQHQMENLRVDLSALARPSQREKGAQDEIQ